MTTSLFGGVLIGISVSLMFLFTGRVTGISGIVSGLLSPRKGEYQWRLFFILGLLAGGLVLRQKLPSAFQEISSATWFDYVFAGLLVGFGTLLGNGCTSGHGVCGISRFSIRSILATLTFMIFGIISVLIFKMTRGQ